MKKYNKYHHTLVSENMFLNVYADNPKWLALSLLIKYRFGSSVVYGTSYNQIANKLKVSPKTLLQCLRSESAKCLFKIKKRKISGKEMIYIKVNKLCAEGKNVIIDFSKHQYFDTRHMRVGIGSKVTIKTIENKLYVVKAVMCAHRQGNAIYSTYGVLKSALRFFEEEANNREGGSSDYEEKEMDHRIWTGCSLKTFAQKLNTGRGKVITVLREAVRLCALTKRGRKISYQSEPTGLKSAVYRKENGKFVMVFPNGKVIEQLSNEYYTTRIKYKRLKKAKKGRTLKDGTMVPAKNLRKRVSGSNGKLKRYWLPKRVPLKEGAIWKPLEGLSDPDIVNGYIVHCKTTEGQADYVTTDRLKQVVKSLSKSKDPENKALGKEILQNQSDKNVALPYTKDKKKEKGQNAFIKMLEGISRTANNYAFSNIHDHDKEYIMASMEKYMVGTYRIFEIVSFILDLKKFQAKENAKMKKRIDQGEPCGLFRIDDNFMRYLIETMNGEDRLHRKPNPEPVEDTEGDEELGPIEKWRKDKSKGTKQFREEEMLEKVSPASRVLFREFIDKTRRSWDHQSKDVEICMDAVWRYLACTTELSKYIYQKRVDLLTNENTVNFKDYMILESKRYIDEVIGSNG